MYTCLQCEGKFDYNALLSPALQRPKAQETRGLPIILFELILLFEQLNVKMNKVTLSKRGCSQIDLSTLKESKVRCNGYVATIRI